MAGINGFRSVHCGSVGVSGDALGQPKEQAGALISAVLGILPVLQPDTLHLYGLSS